MRRRADQSHPENIPGRKYPSPDFAENLSIWLPSDHDRRRMRPRPTANIRHYVHAGCRGDGERYCRKPVFERKTVSTYRSRIMQKWA
ncbi:MAG: hypothetical protein R2874_10325 [Desulfobacterales bacterium]